ncbi:MAG: glucose-1-phosphate cytidylyltransferase [Candidatus Altiarchaeota archaeon]|nr:glucose-1-phosphate cytidylyltransferase [Candidatus Altiarchaeota archaeon]
MKVVILCGGMGMRLREETEYKPKPMIAIGGKPVLWHIMKVYSHYGFKEFILALGYKGEVIKDYFYNYEILNNDFTIGLGSQKNIEIHSNHREQGWRITLADTGDKALKGSRIKKIEHYVDGDLFMLTYGDGIANIDLRELLSFHKNHGCIGTVTGVRPISRFGELAVEKDRVTSFMEKPQLSEGLVNGGFFVFNRDIFNYLSEDDNCDFEFGPLEQLAKDGELKVYKHEKDWECMDTFRDMKHLNKLWKNNEAFWKIWGD